MELRGKTVLVIENDEFTRKQIHLQLQQAGFEMMEAADGLAGKQMFEKYDPCFVIMEFVLPKMNGDQLCRWIRKDMNSDVPIIFLSVKTSEQDRIAGLLLGADDYVTKPFSPQELVIRVETVLRRTAQRCNKLSFRGLTLKPLRGEVKFKGQDIVLTKHEFRLLHFLMKHPYHVVTRSQILQDLYPNDEKHVTDRTVDVHVSKLRDKLNQIEQMPPFIETIRGMGYRFAP